MNSFIVLIRIWKIHAGIRHLKGLIKKDVTLLGDIKASFLIKSYTWSKTISCGEITIVGKFILPLRKKDYFLKTWILNLNPKSLE